MQKFCLLIFIVLLTVATLAAQNNCQSVSTSETTFWGNGFMLIDGGDQTSRKAKGVLTGEGGKPTSGVLVEVFLAADEGKSRLIGPEYYYPRITACRTDADGKFHFPDLPPGRYEMILSKNNNITMVIPIKIDPNARKYATKRFKIYY